MLDVNIEFIKGVLFVKLSGKINRQSEKNIKSNVISIIKEGGIKYLVFNIKELDVEEELELFNECNRLIKLNKGKMIICNKENNNKNIEYAKDELSALRIINI